jgi:hypothetical protein
MTDPTTYESFLENLYGLPFAELQRRGIVNAEDNGSRSEYRNEW